MAINIQNLLDAIAAKSASNTPGTLSAGESDALVNLVTETSNLYDTFYQSDSATDYSTSQGGLVKTLYSLNTDSFYFTSGRGEWTKQNFLSSTVVDQSPRFQGETVGLVGTFQSYTAPNSYSDFRRIQTFSLASNANATETNNLYVPSPTNPTSAPLGASGKAGFPNHVSHAYMAGGPNTPSPDPATPSNNYSTLIDKYPFAITTELAVNAGDLSTGHESGAAVSSETNGYVAGGFANPVAPNSINSIQQFNFSSEGTASNVGSLSVDLYDAGGHCDQTDGYISAGRYGGGATNISSIQKFPLVNPITVTTVGNISVAKTQHGSISSFTHGYTIGGTNGLDMEKFQFASSTSGSVNATLSLVTALDPTYTIFQRTSGISGYDYGYYAGGRLAPLPNNGAMTLISRFPYSAESNQSDIGDLVRNSRNAASNQG